MITVEYDDQRDSGSDICGLSLKPKGRVLEGFGYKSSLMNWKPEILKKWNCEIRSKCETMVKMMMSDRA